MLKHTPNPTFKAPVKIPTPGGHLTITFEFKYRAKKELEEYIKAPRDGSKSEAEEMLNVAVGWDMPDSSFDAESLGQLFELYQKAPYTIMTEYLDQLGPVKLGN